MLMSFFSVVKWLQVPQENLPWISSSSIDLFWNFSGDYFAMPSTKSFRNYSNDSFAICEYLAVWQKRMQFLIFSFFFYLNNWVIFLKRFPYTDAERIKVSYESVFQEPNWKFGLKIISVIFENIFQQEKLRRYFGPSSKIKM